MLPVCIQLFNAGYEVNKRSFQISLVPLVKRIRCWSTNFIVITLVEGARKRVPLSIAQLFFVITYVVLLH
jgi:hypothetical protein